MGMRKVGWVRQDKKKGQDGECICLLFVTLLCLIRTLCWQSNNEYACFGLFRK